jgi:hypothetical protein
LFVGIRHYVPRGEDAWRLGFPLPVCNNLAAFVQVHQVAHEAALGHVANLDKHRRDGELLHLSSLLVLHSHGLDLRVAFYLHHLAVGDKHGLPKSPGLFEELLVVDRLVRWEYPVELISNRGEDSHGLPSQVAPAHQRDVLPPEKRRVAYGAVRYAPVFELGLARDVELLGGLPKGEDHGEASVLVAPLSLEHKHVVLLLNRLHLVEYDLGAERSRLLLHALGELRPRNLGDGGVVLNQRRHVELSPQVFAYYQSLEPLSRGVKRRRESGDACTYYYHVVIDLHGNHSDGYL